MRPARIHDRVAPVYDLYSGPMEWMGGARRRRRVLARATGEVLEAGVGTVLNLEHYPPGVHVTGIDISARMLAHARRRAEEAAADVTLDVADVEDLPYVRSASESLDADGLRWRAREDRQHS